MLAPPAPLMLGLGHALNEALDRLAEDQGVSVAAGFEGALIDACLLLSKAGDGQGRAVQGTFVSSPGATEPP